MRRLVEQGRDIARQLGDPVGRHALSVEIQAFWCGLRRVATLCPLIRRGVFSLWNFIEYWAKRQPESKALSDEHGSLNWRQLYIRASEWGISLRHRGVGPGVHVALVAENSTELIVALFAIQWAGGEVFLLDARSDGEWLSQALSEFKASLLLVNDTHVLDTLSAPPECTALHLATLSEALADARTEPCPKRRHVGPEPVVWLVTSGTTGRPKRTCVSNRRAVLSGLGISAPCLALKPSDVIYCVLPLSHATGYLTGLCAAIVAGCTLATRRRLKTEGFWNELRRERATCLIYVGELARYLLAAPVESSGQSHGLRIAYGNGMALDVWHRFQSRFRIPKILEFYGATELPLALVNLGGHPGSIGHTPFAHLSPWRIVRRDTESAELVRDDQGICVACGPDEAGELVLLTSLFDGKRWGSSESSPMSSVGQHMQYVKCVAARGDWGLRTGDIVLRDANGYVGFVNRTFEVFRQKGRNISTTHLARVLRQFVGVGAVGVTHLTLPHYDGQLGLVVIVPTDGFSLAQLEAQYNCLADYERPRFLRVAGELRLNRGYKFDQTAYRLEGLDPARAGESIYAYAAGHFCRITADVRREISLGHFRF